MPNTPTALAAASLLGPDSFTSLVLASAGVSMVSSSWRRLGTLSDW